MEFSHKSTVHRTNKQWGVAKNFLTSTQSRNAFKPAPWSRHSWFISATMMLMRLTKRKARELAEVHQYVEDLKQVTILRNHSTDKEEKLRYTESIEIMQIVLNILNGGGKNV